MCGLCGTVIGAEDDGICQQCWGQIANSAGGDYCPRCGRDVSKYGVLGGRCGWCQAKEFQFDGIARAGVYSDAIRDMILAFKFKDRTEFANRLKMFTNAAFAGSEFCKQIDLVVPVPLHWKRRLGRGYNQAELLCKGGTFDISTDLVRVRNTKRQWDLTPSKRRKNVAGAFAVRKRHGFAGKNICLVDDIATSGATLNECARALKMAGANKVFALVVAVAMQDD
jgi:competence protein ComFC